MADKKDQQTESYSPAQMVTEFTKVLRSPEGRERILATLKQFPIEMYHGLVNTLSAPHDVYEGTIKPGSDAEIQAAMGLASLFGSPMDARAVLPGAPARSAALKINDRIDPVNRATGAMDTPEVTPTLSHGTPTMLKM